MNKINRTCCKAGLLVAVSIERELQALLTAAILTSLQGKQV